jgi:uncharacterized protein
MAKLARLMIPEQSLIIEPEKIAISGNGLIGELALRNMPRLTEIVLIGSEMAKYHLAFLKCDNGIIQIKGEISTSLMARCQRCLNQMTLNLTIPVNIGVISSHEESELLEDEMEPFLAEDKEVSLQELIEEEILLSLPISALHAEESCPVKQDVNEEITNRVNPFEVLKSLKKKNS